MIRWLICNLFHRRYWTFEIQRYGDDAGWENGSSRWGHCTKCNRFWLANLPGRHGGMGS